MFISINPSVFSHLFKSQQSPTLSFTRRRRRAINICATLITDRLRARPDRIALIVVSGGLKFLDDAPHKRFLASFFLIIPELPDR
jgi:hypothetical protein